MGIGISGYQRPFCRAGSRFESSSDNLLCTRRRIPDLRNAGGIARTAVSLLPCYRDGSAGFELGQRRKVTRLEIEYSDPAYPLDPIPFDSFIASIAGLCRLAVSPEFNPVEVRLAFADNHRGGDYEALFKAPVVFGAQKNALVFDSFALNEALPGRSSDLLQASDRILENYIAALNPDEISTEVRKLLMTMLPTGNANQEMVSKRLHMSRSTLHRRLRDENTNYKELFDSTRRSLAIEYVQDGQYALGYVAFLLGFSDQSNFSRAFRRWTGKSPKAYRDPGASAGLSAGPH